MSDARRRNIDESQAVPLLPSDFLFFPSLCTSSQCSPFYLHNFCSASSCAPSLLLPSTLAPFSMSLQFGVLLHGPSARSFPLRFSRISQLERRRRGIAGALSRVACKGENEAPSALFGSCSSGSTTTFSSFRLSLSFHHLSLYA